MTSNNAIPDIIEKVKSGIIHIIHIKNNKRVSSGTGFMVNGYLVTNYHVIYDPPQDTDIILRTYDAAPQKFLEGIALKRNNQGFVSNTETANDKNNGDYIVINVPELKEKNLYNFEFESPKNKRLGEPILFLGYHLDHDRMTAHNGFISSFYKSKNIDVIQIDASVNNGSSGSPLIDPITCKVIGIITRKETGFTQYFEKLNSLVQKNRILLGEQINDLKKIIPKENKKQTIINNLRKRFPKENKKQLKQKGKLPKLQKVLENQVRKQIINLDILVKNNIVSEGLIIELYRSANVGIGHAFSVENIMNENCFCDNQ